MSYNSQTYTTGLFSPRHETSQQEIADLLAIVARDLADAGSNISPDWRFGIAYNGALKLSTILLHASGYRPEKTLQHYRATACVMSFLSPPVRRKRKALPKASVAR